MVVCELESVVDKAMQTLEKHHSEVEIRSENVMQGQL
jgi:hypothetical protein